MQLSPASVLSPPSQHLPPTSLSLPRNNLSSSRRADAATPKIQTIDTRTHIANLEKLLSVTPPAAAPPPSPRGLIHSSLRLPPLLFPRNDNDDASPRSLNHLRYLLSESAQYPSPRTSIAGRWHELQGSDDWSSLLDPLDADLRREILRNGDFVHSAYHAFFHSPAFSVDSPRPVSLPDRSYRLTHHLFATASLVPPPWVPSWTSHRSAWIGFVAVCDNDREIRRMGRRDIVVALRGTSTCLEWAENLRINLVPLDADGSDFATPKVECGFRSLYTTPGQRVPSLSAAVVEDVRRLVELCHGEEMSITITGHSLGAALAVLIADELAASSPEMPPIAVFSFGGPRVGNRAFAERVEKQNGVKVLRVVNAHDFVTRVPASFGGGGRFWRDGYEHVGKELIVDSRASPFLKPDADPACCHDLEAYLHLIDGLGGGAGCRFRPNAKRSPVRLLSQQPGNVKKLYMSKARALGLGPEQETGQPGSGWSASPSS